MDFDRLRRAAEEAAWLVARGYPAAAVSGFVAGHRELTGEEQGLLACGTRLRAEYAKHIARELDPEDVAKRPLRVDVSSVLSAIDAGVAGRPVVQSPAGVLADPDWRRPGAELTDLAGAVDRLQAAVKGLRPSEVRWYIDEAAPWADRVAEKVEKSAKPKAEVVRVADASGTLARAAYVASSDPSVLDGAACWVNVVSRALADVPAKVIRLED